MSDYQWRVLLVEDERDGREVMVDTLALHGILCDAAPTAEKALNLLDVGEYDAAIIDLALPGMDGMTLIRHIREQDQTADLPCLAYTAYHTAKVRQDVMQAGFNDYCQKPLRLETLIGKLKRIIQPD